MKSPRRSFERFCYKHHNWGIPNLMMYISIGAAIVYVMSMIDGSNTLYNFLCFNRSAILHGQIWRLFTFPLAYSSGYSVLLLAVALLCYYSLGRAMENVWGTFKFNLFYLTGLVLMDIFAMCFNLYIDATYLNLSLFLGYSTLYPDARFLLFFIIPVRAWILALFNLAITIIDIVHLSVAGLPFPINLFPLIPIANYLLFFGKDVVNVIPLSWRMKLGSKRSRPVQRPGQKKTGSIPFNGQKQAAEKPYTHKCTVCGRTDVTNPELEFRYCSKCNGYYCYCEDHINNHEHIK